MLAEVLSLAQRAAARTLCSFLGGRTLGCCTFVFQLALNAPLHLPQMSGALPASLLRCVLDHLSWLLAATAPRHHAAEVCALLQLKRVCRAWQQQAGSDSLWRAIFQRRYAYQHGLEPTLASAPDEASHTDRHQQLVVHLVRVERLAVARLRHAHMHAELTAVHWAAYRDAGLIDANQLQLLQSRVPANAADAGARAAALLPLAEQLFAAEGLTAALAQPLAALHLHAGAPAALEMFGAALPAETRAARAAALVRVLGRAAPTAWLLRMRAAWLLAMLARAPPAAACAATDEHVRAALEQCGAAVCDAEVSVLRSEPHWCPADVPAIAACVALLLELPVWWLRRSELAGRLYGVQLLPALVRSVEELREVRLVETRAAAAPRGSHVEYVVELRLQYHCWRHSTRYSELLRLHQALLPLAAAPHAALLAAAFPGKRAGWQPLGRGNALEQRRVQLQRYLDLVFGTPSLSAAAPLLRFFHCPPLLRIHPPKPLPNV